MATLIIIAVLVGLLIGAGMWVASMAARAVTGKAATKALEDVQDANRPLSDPELERMRARFKRGVRDLPAD